MSDIIVACNSQNKESCNEANELSRAGCMKGTIGPLCETCDVRATLWPDRYIHSFSGFQCGKCIQDGYQIGFLILGLLIIFFYLVGSVHIFMNSYIYNSRCCYLRLLSIMPFSKSSILDESTYFIKALLNYI